jgi:hypothetical protein
VTNPTNATDAVQRVREFATRYRGNRPDQLTDYERKALDAVDALLARLADVEAENASLREAANKASEAIHWLYEAHRTDVDPWSEGPLQDFGKADHPLTRAQDALRAALDAARTTEGTR